MQEGPAQSGPFVSCVSSITMDDPLDGHDLFHDQI